MFMPIMNQLPETLVTCKPTSHSKELSKPET